VCFELPRLTTHCTHARRHYQAARWEFRPAGPALAKRQPGEMGDGPVEREVARFRDEASTLYMPSGNPLPPLPSELAPLPPHGNGVEA
jgi:hypothetical protein